MESLRWVLLALGTVLIVGVYLWDRGTLRPPSIVRRRRHRSRGRIEPTAGPGYSALEESADDGSAEQAGLDAADLDAGAEQAPDVEDERVTEHEREPEPEPEPPETERVVTIRLVPKQGRWNGQTTVLALRAAGLQHGRFGIFHRLPDDDGSREPLFSVANLTEPGSFDLTNLASTTLPGMSFFLVLPGVGDPVERFDRMVDTARSLALELDGELHDDRGSSWSIQRERYVREQIIQYRYQLERAQ